MRFTALALALGLLTACSGSSTKAEEPITLVRETVAATATTLALD